MSSRAWGSLFLFNIDHGFVQIRTLFLFLQFDRVLLDNALKSKTEWKS